MRATVLAASSLRTWGTARSATPASSSSRGGRSCPPTPTRTGTTWWTRGQGPESRMCSKTRRRKWHTWRPQTSTCTRENTCIDDGGSGPCQSDQILTSVSRNTRICWTLLIRTTGGGRDEYNAVIEHVKLTGRFFFRELWNCGVVYVGQLGEVMVDKRFSRHCSVESSNACETPVQNSSSDVSSSLDKDLENHDPENEEFYAETKKENLARIDTAVNNNDNVHDESFYEKLEKKMDTFSSSPSLITSHWICSFFPLSPIWRCKFISVDLELCHFIGVFNIFGLKSSKSSHFYKLKVLKIILRR